MLQSLVDSLPMTARSHDYKASDKKLTKSVEVVCAKHCAVNMSKHP